MSQQQVSITLSCCTNAPELGLNARHKFERPHMTFLHFLFSRTTSTLILLGKLLVTSKKAANFYVGETDVTECSENA